MIQNRIINYKELERLTDSIVLVYITGDRPGFQTQMGQDVYDLFVDQLEAIGKVKRISLYLYSRGGEISVPGRSSTFSTKTAKIGHAERDLMIRGTR